MSTSKIRTVFSARLVEIMAVKGLSQLDLAALVDVAQGTVSGWLNGALPQPQKERIICEKLGVSREWLIEGIGSTLSKAKTDDKIHLGLVTPLILNQAKSLKRLHENLKAIRGIMTPSEFAQIAGLSSGAVYERYEKGRVPRPAILQRIALHIGTTAGELMAPMSEERVRQIQSGMVRTSKELIFPKRGLAHRTYWVLMQARREFVTPETQRAIGDIFALKTLDPETLSKLYQHLERTTFKAPVEIGRYYYPLLDAVGAEINRRAEGRK